MSDKRVGFAPAHHSVQHPPQWHEPSLVGNLVDPNPDAQLHAALEDARLKVQRLEAQLQQKSLQRIPGPGPAVHSTAEGPLYADLHGQHVVQSPQAPPARHGSGTGRTSTFILPDMFGSAEFNSSTQPVPQPPAGYTYVWQYAGYRNKDGSITFGPKGDASAGQDDGTHASKGKEDACMSTSQDASYALQQQASSFERIPFPPLLSGVTPHKDNMGPSHHGVANLLGPSTAVLFSGSDGRKMLTPEQCQAFGVPFGACWKENSSSARKEALPPSPVMYGGYMPKMGANGSSTPAMQNDRSPLSWQA